LIKVILVNGSPRMQGNTNAALNEVAKALQNNGVETEIFWIGNKPMQCCIACNGCRHTGKCVTNDDVNQFAQKMSTADALIVGTPVYYASAAGALRGWLDRLFYSHSTEFRGKLGSAVAVCRRGGATATIDQINKYFLFAEMPVVSSQYWNIIHGAKPDEVKLDSEGMQTMRVLGNNTAWLLKCIQAGKNAGVALPKQEERTWTNFVR